MTAPVKILHLHSTFSLGGKEARAVQIMNDFGERAAHTIVSAMPDALGAREAIADRIAVDFPQDAPPLAGRPGRARFKALADYMCGFDLVLSYNWGAMDGVMAHRLGKGLPPIIHHEDGFNADEANGLKPSRNWYRRVAFPTLYRLVVPSRTLEEIAHSSWKQPGGRVERIDNGIAVERYLEPPEAGAIPGFERRPGEVVVGTIAGLREVKDIPRLVSAVASLPDHIRLVVVGEGPERGAIEAAAKDHGAADRVLLAGFLDRPWRYVGHFDIFALSSKSEQFPISVVEAMAAGLPVAAPAVGDIANMVAEPNTPFIVPPDSGAAGLAQAIETLAASQNLRETVGAANRARAVSDYDEQTMLERYRALYGNVLGRNDLFAR